MKPKKPPIDLDAEARRSPVVWFALLDKAREAGDWATAQYAQDQLERLGVRVRFARRRAAGHE